MEIYIKGFKDMNIENLLLDYNGTIGRSGKLISEIVPLLKKLSEALNIYVITADTNNTVSSELKDLPVEIIIIKGIDEDKEKLEALEKLGKDCTVAIGNGNNDVHILKESILGIGIIDEEGISTKALLNSDIIVKNPVDALLLLLNPKRLIATLRN